MQRKEKINYQEKIDKFCNAAGLKDLAALLNFKAKNLSYILYHLDSGRENQYSSFEIAKKNGGKRNISAPSSALKEVQRRLNELLQLYFSRLLFRKSFNVSDVVLLLRINTWSSNNP